MSNDGNEPSAPGRGLRFIKEVGAQKRQLASWLEVSTEWRGGFLVQRIAQELSSAHSDQQLALIAAQLWLERQALETALRESGERISVADAAAFTSAALKAYRKAKWGKGGKARNAETTEMKSDALAAWDARDANVSSMTAFARYNHRKFNVKERTLYKWISDYEKTKP